MSNVSLQFEAACQQITDSIRQQMEARSYRVANELRNASQLVLRGQRNGRIYTVPNTKSKYQASAPGEAPANRTGVFRMAWKPTALKDNGAYISRIENNIQVGTERKYLLGDLLEEGTVKMEPRPYKDRILETAEPDIVRIYSESYF